MQNKDLYCLLEGLKNIEKISDFELAKKVVENKRKISKTLKEAEEKRDELLQKGDNYKRLLEYEYRIQRLNNKYLKQDKQGNYIYDDNGDPIVDMSNQSYKSERGKIYNNYKSIVDKRIQSLNDFKDWLNKEVDIELDIIKMKDLGEDAKKQLTGEILDQLYEIIELD